MCRMRICTSVTDFEVDRAKNQLKTSILSDITNTSTACRQLARWVSSSRHHTHFNGHFPGEPGLVVCLLGFLSAVITNLLKLVSSWHDLYFIIFVSAPLLADRKDEIQWMSLALVGDRKGIWPHNLYKLPLVECAVMNLLQLVSWCHNLDLQYFQERMMISIGCL